jgi:uncharacterized protein (TIGR00369 family)
MNDEHYRKLERMYAAAPCNAHYRPEMTIGEGTAEVRIPVRPDLFHAAGAVHGSVYFKAMDDAAFFAVNSLVEEVFALTVSFHVHLLRPVSSGAMRGVGRVVFASRSLYVAEAAVYDDRGREVGRGSGTFVPGKVRLTAEIGYAL